jgi:penicillin amidase
MKWLKRCALALVAVSALAGAALWAYARQALPATEGRLQLPGLDAPVRIERDAQGVPTIRAATRDAALFGLGFAHAQDRLWQMEMHRRIGAGRLSEVLGEAALPTDRFLRALGVRHAAAAQWRAASPDTRAALSAYAAGVNAFVSRQMRARPPEFIVLGVHPEPWSAEDSLAWSLMMAWDLGGNWTAELLRLHLALRLPVARINELMPPYPGDKPLPTADYAALYRSLGLDGSLGRQALQAAPESGVEGVGSNSWVLAGARTESGRPLLANDPHLKLSAPSLWYMARLDAPGFKVAGATIPGLPAVVLGQNEHLAWGFTNAGPDVQDLYIERIHPDDPSQYQTPTGWAAFEAATETIRVKGRADVSVVVRRSRHGPVISDAAGPTQGLTGPAARPAYALALRWTALDVDAGATTDAALAFNAARSVADFIKASKRYVAPMQNMVVADRDGHIGMVAAGRVPLRKPDNDLRGLAPAPGWEARYDWAGHLDPGDTPREVDPPQGWIASANQRNHPIGYPHFITSEWTAPYRHERIGQLLSAQPKHGLDSLRRIQSDLHSAATLRLLPFLRQARSSHPLAEAAQRELAGFDGVMAADKAAPLIAWAWARQLTIGVFRDEVGEALFDKQFSASRSFRDALEGVLERGDAWWCDDKGTAGAETCAAQIDAAFTHALDELQAAHGADVARWQWGRAHMARSEHRPFSKVRLLAPWFELRTPTGGDNYTLNVSRVTLQPDAATGELYLNEHAASLRALYDLAEPGRSRYMFSTGQSGIAFSPLYRHFVEPWRQVQDLPLWAGEARHVLVLEPPSPD